MKNFYQWYRKHITGAIFTGLILGILTGLFLQEDLKLFSQQQVCWEAFI